MAAGPAAPGRPTYLALDVGTTSVRALVVDRRGRVLGRARETLATRHPAPGRVEQDPAELRDRGLSVLRGALREAGLRGEEVAGLGISTQRASAVAWDAYTGEPLSPLIGWQDRRTEPRARELAARGVHFGTLPAVLKFEWLLREDPRVADAARAGRLRLGTPDAWLHAALSGAPDAVTDPTQAACTALTTGSGRRWSRPALDLVGIDETWLPRIAASAEVRGRTRAGLLGAPVPLAGRAGDQQASSFAWGVRAPGTGRLSLGTSAMLEVAVRDPEGVDPPGVYRLPLADWPGAPAAVCREASVLTAGACVEWLVRIGVLASAQELDARVAAAAPAAVPRFLPALQGLGAPYDRPAVQGRLTGFTLATGAPELCAAVVEGIAQRCADLVEALDPRAPVLAVDGGLSASRELLARLADLTGLPVLRAPEPETAALGAARLAARAVGDPEAGDPGEAWFRVEEGARVEPRISAEERRRRRSGFGAELRAVDPNPP